MAKFRNSSIHRAFLPGIACLLSVSGVLSGCSRGELPAEAPLPLVSAAEKLRLCPPNRPSKPIFEKKYSGRKSGGNISFNDIRDAVNSACLSCHRVPSNTGGFTYSDSYQGREVSVGGVTRYYPGLYESAEKIAQYIFHDDASKRMPPESRRKQNPEAFLKVGRDIQAWIAAGKPEGSFARPVDAADAARIAADPAGLLSSGELGECTPAAEAIGFDYRKDRFFAQATKLPPTLADTDLVTLDSFELARRGTVAYNVEYPLWADNADKGRWIHVPMKIEGGQLVRQKIHYDSKTRRFTIPENTRLYKNFYKQVKDAAGKPWYRRIETRIIVVRYPYQSSLFGSYRWDETEQVATLVETPYRDGSGFKDQLFTVVTDAKKGTTRKYALPGSQRCLECHMGSESESFVLGFTPLQINRRALGEAGRQESTSPEELSQADRLVKYGIVDGYLRGEELPRLEWMGARNPRNIYEVRAQGYFAGNCAHCHNPKGFAFQSGAPLDLSAGEIYDFNTYLRSTQRQNRPYVHHEGDPERSHIYLKVADPPEAQGLTSRMPMHTPGIPDCRALQVIGKWIKTWEGIDAAEAFEPDCKKKEDFDWVDQDFTWPKDDKYVPRRADWNDPKMGMSAEPYRQLVYSEGLRKKVTQEYAVGYWNKKDGCVFPEVNLPPEKQRPWMLAGGKPKRPFGEVYSTTPGSWYYRTTCAKCHGNQADGNTALARGILNWSGGSVRVADLMNGLFGNNGANLALFDVPQAGGGTRNLGGNYLIWMAMEGTRVQFPPEASNFVGKHGAQMLNQIREKCLRQISPEKASTPNFPDHEIFREVCFFDNRAPGDPALQYDRSSGQALNPPAVEEWLNRATFNAGWAIYQYLHDASQGNWKIGNDECEKLGK